MATLISENELMNIVMKCSDEDDNYRDPKKMLNVNGTSKYAYVTVVMMGDLYVAGAITLAHSIRKAKSHADIVVLVTPDVSRNGKIILESYFDHVIDIEYVHIKNWRVRKQSHKKYLEYVFTKFHVFNLTQYDKILLIDADALILKHPDHLFTLNTPAGCFIEDKESIITYDENGNYILPEDGKIKWYEKYHNCGHGKIIPKEMTDKVRHDPKNSGIGGGLILLEPKKGEFNAILKDISKGQIKYLVENQFIWPEQQYLCLRYSGKWTGINPIFFGLQGYPHWKLLFGLQYGGDKPFMLSSKFDIKTRLQYPDFILWHRYYKNILEKHPKFNSSNALYEANEMNKYFDISTKHPELNSHEILHEATKS